MTQILIVEDERIIAADIEHSLKKRGYGVVGIASSGEKALELVSLHQPDLILMDVVLKGDMNGISTVKRVRETHDIPVIWLTAHSDKSTIQQIKMTQPHGYILKPINQRELFSTVEIALYRHQMDRKLKESESRYRILVETVNEGLCVIDEKGELTFANNRLTEFLGTRLEDLMGNGYQSRLEESACRTLIEHITNMDLKENTSFELPWTHTDGNTVYTLVSPRGRFDNEGVYEGCFCVITDISARKAAERKAEEQQQLLLQADKLASLGVLVAGVAHEINNPNQAIMSNISFLGEAWENTGVILEEYYQANGDFMICGIDYSDFKNKFPLYIGRIAEGARRIDAIVKNLKEFYRQEESRMESIVNINMVVQSAITLLRNYITNHTGGFSTQFEDNLPKIRGDSQKLEQVFINLIQNACQSLTDRKGTVTVTTRCSGFPEEVVVEVIDDGKGVDPENLTKIKDPFFTTNREKGGTGLGLSISNTIIKKHGGSLDIESSPGGGTHISVRFPVRA